jgi:hypothetical protein
MGLDLTMEQKGQLHSRTEHRPNMVIRRLSGKGRFTDLANWRKMTIKWLSGASNESYSECVVPYE